MTTNYEAQLLAKAEARSAILGVIGLGYVGLPLAVELAELFDRTPPNVSQMDSWLVQKLLEHTPKTEDFYR